MIDIRTKYLYKKLSFYNNCLYIKRMKHDINIKSINLIKKELCFCFDNIA